MSREILPFPVIKPDLQVSFYHRIEIFQHSYLSEALRETVQKLDIAKLDHELSTYSDARSLAKLASFGIRGEVFFCVPYLVLTRPSLLGYYRLLYGLSQKEFYRIPQIAPFKRLEERNQITDKLSSQVNWLCTGLASTAKILIDSMNNINLRLVRDLQLLTLGAQFRGGQNTKLGKDATAEVFSLIEKIVHSSLIEETPRKLVLNNAAGRKVTVAFSSDPDIAITETMPSGPRPIVSIEIKGGTDVSNIHNRIGEAEKSHQKAKSRGFFEFWTMLGANVDLIMAKRESPTTSRFFHISQLRNTSSSEYEAFFEIVQSIVGISSI